MKAILVVDIGNDEYLLNKEIDSICFKDGDKIYDNFKLLKPLPEFKHEHFMCFSAELSGIINSENRGWNDCLTEILGDEEW